jgi:hypothetical protein
VSRGQNPVLNPIEALRLYTKQGRITYEVADMADALMDESDRGVVVILGSLLEDLLLERVLEALGSLGRRLNQKELVRSGGVLGSFERRLAVGQALGVIDDDMVEFLQIVAELRNACAHSRQDIGFLTPELKNVLAMLFDGAENAEEVRQGSDAFGVRWMFIVAFVYIAAVLKGESPEKAAAKSQRLMDQALIYASLEVLKHRASLEKRRLRYAERHRSQSTK